MRQGRPAVSNLQEQLSDLENKEFLDMVRSELGRRNGQSNEPFYVSEEHPVHKELMALYLVSERFGE